MSKALIIHHNDQDGRMGGYIMFKYYEDLGYHTEAMEVDHTKEFEFNGLVESGDKVCIVDFALKPADMAMLQNFVDASDIVWIDHHKSSIESYTDQANLDGIRYIGKSGCELAYIYSQGYRIKRDSKCVNIKITNGEMEFIDIDNIELPRAVKLVGDWDVWRKTKDSRQFAYALRAYWPLNRIDVAPGREFWERLIDDQGGNIDALINEGYTIMRYIEAQNMTDCRNLAFPVKLRKFESFDCIAINSTFGSSLIFDSVFNQHEVGIIFRYGEDGVKKFMHVSLYRLGKNPDKNIDLSFVAKTFGGGGHPDASGFITSGTLPFV
jgi:oligoribonuclease NrnB/cAMP/cGMP phosphodiesterase (DHH superfamily)